MTIASILATKGRKLITVAPDTPVNEAAGILHKNEIGAVLVMQGETLLGVLSDRGIVRAMALHPSGVRAMTAQSVMRPFQFEAYPSTTLDEAMRIMTDNKVRYLPVFDEGKLIGVISIGDVVKAELNRNVNQVENLTAYISGS